ncbi:MAG TPA: GGDEF domain-containing protein [Terriglobales bacterium]|nr:GGDEF domain-containing protein [Terriglobales bacterium]
MERRRASRSLWQACEALLSAAVDPHALQQALADLRAAFDCDGVVLRARGPSGALEPWQACGEWGLRAGDLRDCLTVPLLRGSERVGTLDLLARAGQRWQPGQLGLVRAASGALGAALGAGFELERLRRQPGRDAATGLPDEDAFRGRLTEELARVRMHGAPLALALIELGRFGALERRYGAGVARAVLAEAGLVLRMALREADTLARWKGPCFAVLLPETEPASALRVTERLRRVLEDHRFARVGHLVVSAGIATCPRDGLDPAEVLERVERALALAVKAGRGRVIATEPAHVH